MDRTLLPPRRWLARSVLAVVVACLLVPVGISAYTHEPTALGPGTVTEPADDRTYVSVQGFHFEGRENQKKPARLVAAGERGEPEWVYNGSARGATWFYDVDPLPGGTLLVTSTEPGRTVVYEFDPDTGERRWSETFPIEDTHDVDMLSDEELVVANMRAYDESADRSTDRLFIYNLTTDEITWEWSFRKHFPAGTDGGYDDDWTHVNDVDVIDEHRLLVSPRNFDQVLLVNRTTNEIELRLGEDGAGEVLYEQHNPDYLEGPDGTPTILVADSENDRIVEYAYQGGQWVRTWELSGNLNWPRDTDRLPNGNTLVTDTLNHRVIEVTPQGEVVWEFYAPWAPYDAERLHEYAGRTAPTPAAAGAVVDDGSPRDAVTGGSAGPTIREQGLEGAYEVSGGADRGPGARTGFADWLAAAGAGTSIAREVRWLAERYRHVAPFVRPVWLSSWALASLIAALVVLLGWGSVELLYQRRRLRRAVGRLIVRG